MGGIFSSMVSQVNSTNQVKPPNFGQPSTPQPVASTPQPVATAPQPVASSPQPVALTPKSVVSTPQQVALTPKSVVSTPQPIATTPQQVASKSTQAIEAVQTKIKKTVEEIEQKTTENVQALGVKIKETTAPIQQKVTETIKEKTGLDLTVEQEDPLYGKGITLLEFICSIWSRLAYMNNTNFVSHYKNIFEDSVVIDEGGVTVKMAMEGINEDQSYLTKFVKFMPFAEHVNIINGEASKVKKSWSNMVKSRSKDELNCSDTIPLPSPEQQNLILTTIGTSNYSQCCVFADIRMPNIICVSFRGTYSPKSAGSYTQFSSLLPTQLTPDSKVKVLSGVYKIMIEMVHTILCAIDDLKEQLKPHTKNTNFKLIVTGHSLGGALATLFTYVYMKTTTITKESQVTCVSLGAPRVFNPEGAREFCKMVVVDKLFTFKRVTTLNDPVPALPKIGYEHVCSDNDANREKINLDCLAQIDNSSSERCKLDMRLSATPNYKRKLSCTNKKDRKKNKMGLTDSPLLKHVAGYHVIYLGVLYMGAISLSSFMALPFFKSSVEINRFPFEKDATTTTKRMTGNLGDTACKLCFYDGNVYKTVFFNLVHFRKQNGRYYEDVYVTPENFKTIKDKASHIKPDTILPTDNGVLSSNPVKSITPDTFPLPDKVQPFLLIMPSTIEPVIPDGTEPTPEDIKKSQTSMEEIEKLTPELSENKPEPTEAPVSDVPTTVSEPTEAPVSDVPTTVSEPTTEAPVSDVSTTVPEPTEATLSDASTSPEPTTEAPVSDVPTTPEPTTEAPVSDVPTTVSEPTTEAPISDVSTTETSPNPNKNLDLNAIANENIPTISNSAIAGGRKSLKKSKKKKSVKRRKYKIKKTVRKYN
jgi:hypothetical protein